MNVRTLNLSHRTLSVTWCWTPNMFTCVAGEYGSVCFGIRTLFGAWCSTESIHSSRDHKHYWHWSSSRGLCVCARVRVGGGWSGRGKHDHFLPPLENKTNRKLSNSRSRWRLSEEPTETVKSSRTRRIPQQNTQWDMTALGSSGLF